MYATYSTCIVYSTCTYNSVNVSVNILSFSVELGALCYTCNGIERNEQWYNVVG